ncbi:YIP1 family protein [Kitasatospora sp. NPDC050543]|uniref:YIP1 family protein n=1 Tax=Kitasatospora sp. NPDC050543 TaxID=3364054 RepID=UPI0037B15959
MAGNRYDNGQGADPRQGRTAPPAGYPQAQYGQQQYGQADGPEFFTAPHPGPGRGPDNGRPAAGSGAAGPGPSGGPDPFAADQPGHTRAFPVGADPYGPNSPYGAGPQGQGYPPAEYGQQQYGPEYGQQYGPEYGGGYQQEYAQGYPPEYGQEYPGGGYPADQDQGRGRQDNVGVYRAGGQSTPHASGPRPRWRELLIGIYRQPTLTFDRTRDHQVWLPALCVSMIYGVLAVLGMGLTRDDVFNSTFTVALTALAAAAIGFTIAGGVLSAVTYALARQFGGDGPWQSTIGLAALIGWTTDVPRLVLALFLPSGNAVVQVLGWITWLFCAVLLTVMVRRVHDLPWGKAAGAASLQLLALLVLIKLPTLG